MTRQWINSFAVLAGSNSMRPCSYLPAGRLTAPQASYCRPNNCPAGTQHKFTFVLDRSSEGDVIRMSLRRGGQRGIAVAAQWTPDIEGSTATGQQEIRCRREADAGIDDGRTAWDRRRGAMQTQGRSGLTETRWRYIDGALTAGIRQRREAARERQRGGAGRIQHFV